MELGGINWYALILAVAVIVARGFRVGNIYVDNILKKSYFPSINITCNILWHAFIVSFNVSIKQPIFQLRNSILGGARVLVDGKMRWCWSVKVL